MDQEKHCVSLLVLLLSISNILQAHPSVVPPTNRLIGGVEAPDVFGKFQASLQNLQGSHVCGGAVVSPSHVVTAAHCIAGADPQYIKIVVGTVDLDIGGSSYDVKSIEIFEYYNSTSRAHDIAVITAANSFNLNDIEILTLYPEELIEGDPITLTGFGALEANGDSSNKLHVLNLSVFSQKTCKFAMRYSREVFDTMFCTFTAIGQGTCHGDSGSPLIVGNQLAGIVSWGIPCAVGFPDVHTRITPYTSWIKELIKSQE